MFEAIATLKRRVTRSELGRRVAGGASRTILVAGSGAAVSFAVQLGLARVMGKEGYGVYLLALGWVSVAQVISKLDVDVINVRFIAAYASTKQWELLRGIMKAGRQVVFSASIVVALIGAGLVLLLRDQLGDKHPDYASALLVACLILPALNMLMVENAVLQGLHQYARSQLPLVVIRPIALAAVALVFMLVLPDRLTAPLATTANLIAVLVAVVVAGIWSARAVPAEARQVTPVYDRPLWARTALPLVGVSAGQLIVSQQADVLIVGTYFDAAAAGIYGAASQLSLPLGLALASVTYVAQPMVADLYARKDHQRLQSLIRVVTWASGGLAIAIAGIVILLGPWLLGLYRPEFREGYPVLVILVLSQIVQGIGGHLPGYMLTMTAHERAAAAITGASAVVNASLAIILTPIFGPVGTASATLTTAVGRAIVLRVYIRRRMGLRIPAF
jgi:O-antigen/teichoic acid export membrane protein